MSLPSLQRTQQGSVIRARVAALFYFTEAELCGHGRDRDLVEARQLGIYAARQTGLSLNQIARAFNRNHATVIYSLRIVGARAVEGKLPSKFLELLSDLNKAA